MNSTVNFIRVKLPLTFFSLLQLQYTDVQFDAAQVFQEAFQLVRILPQFPPTMKLWLGALILRGMANPSLARVRHSRPSP